MPPAKLINSVFRRLFARPLWIPITQARSIVNQWEQFLLLQQSLSVQAFESGQLLFLANPKSHLLAHKNMLWECDISNHILNPMSMGCQLEEDTVGKIYRLVRRVSPLTAAERSFQRYLISAYASWTREGLLRQVWTEAATDLKRSACQTTRTWVWAIEASMVHLELFHVHA